MYVYICYTDNLFISISKDIRPLMSCAAIHINIDFIPCIAWKNSADICIVRRKINNLTNK